MLISPCCLCQKSKSGNGKRNIMFFFFAFNRDIMLSLMYFDDFFSLAINVNLAKK